MIECHYEVREDRAVCSVCGHARDLPQGMKAAQLHRRCPKSPQYRKSFRRPTPRPKAPGSELKRLLTELRLTTQSGCQCDKRAAQMNAWGIDGCREHFFEISGWLRDEAKQRGWAEKLTAAALAMKTRKWGLFTRDPYAALIETALARAIEAARPREIKTRHLLYHLWPATTDSWRWNVDQILQRIDLFNGRRIVAVAIDDLCSPPAEVKASLAGHDIEILERPNDPRLREAATFVELLSQVETTDPTHATFYSHAKGASRRGKLLSQVIKKWTACLYRENLDDIDRVQHALAAHAMFGVSFSCEPRWQYPGTFWWFHNATVFADTRWKKLENPVSNEGPGWSVEAFPERMFSASECAGPTIELNAPPGTHRSLYSPEIWGLVAADTLDEALARFDEQDYLAMYPDIAAGVSAGEWTSGRAHFIARGFQEKRPI